MRKRVVGFLFKHQKLRWLLWVYYRCFGGCSFYGLQNNSFSIGAQLYKDSFRFHGQNNVINIGLETVFEHSKITIKGNNNRITVGDNSYINGVEIVIEGDNNQILIGNMAFVLDDTRMYVVDGSSLIIGDNCMMSDRIDIRTTDNHSIIDIETNQRINYEKNVLIGNDVWIGTGVTVLKGSEIADGCIIGAKSVIAGKYLTPNAVIAGNPGKQIKTGVRWLMERI